MNPNNGNETYSLLGNIQSIILFTTNNDDDTYNQQQQQKIHIIDPDDPEQITDQTRKLGLVVIRGTQVSLVSPEEGTEEIANPFLGGGDDEEE